MAEIIEKAKAEAAIRLKKKKLVSRNFSLLTMEMNSKNILFPIKHIFGRGSSCRLLSQVKDSSCMKNKI